MTFWSYGHSWGEADSLQRTGRPMNQMWHVTETLREKNRSLSVSVLFIIDASDPKHHASGPNSDSWWLSQLLLSVWGEAEASLSCLRSIDIRHRPECHTTITHQIYGLMASPPSETALRVVLQDLTPITEITFSLSAARCVAPCTLTSVSVRADQTLRETNANFPFLIYMLEKTKKTTWVFLYLEYSKFWNLKKHFICAWCHEKKN